MVGRKGSVIITSWYLHSWHPRFSDTITRYKPNFQQIILMATSELLLPILIEEKTKTTHSENANKRVEKTWKKQQPHNPKPIQSSKVPLWEQYFAVLTYLSMVKTKTRQTSLQNSVKGPDQFANKVYYFFIVLNTYAAASGNHLFDKKYVF